MSSSQMQEIMEMPREFIKDGTQFINRCTKPDKREFLKISQAVGVGFLVMGVIGYVVKLSTCLRHLLLWKGKGHLADADSAVHIPVNNILVGGA
ncbi:hypothetical protein D6C76_04351 [Aureobasidium pullulans]|uniref:Protein translocase SEC61 complex gamma subunit, archaeal and eukaryotic n=1 Tax=Aureobasidium pullulans TaxID=5580 RepID=A0A4S8X7D2_AURPU|nr:hypothetical protein D6D22_08604 [Aureobasidium pullulans]TIA77977.1 hypothetical protein D6C76_04351 [Aureobasidium pullulans]